MKHLFHVSLVFNKGTNFIQECATYEATSYHEALGLALEEHRVKNYQLTLWDSTLIEFPQQEELDRLRNGLVEQCIEHE